MIRRRGLDILDGMQCGDVVGGRYELLNLAGTGGMGIVFRALDRQTGQIVGVKVLSGADEDRLRFAREITNLATASHDNIVRLLDHGAAADGEPFLVMDWVEGESLQRRLERTGLTLAEAVSVAVQIADALGDIHQRGLVHRDLKPSNLMFDGGDLTRLKVIDFGISRALNDGKGLTISGMAVGTPGYMSPEQARGVREVDARTDVFSLGCVLYESITGWTAFPGEHSMALRAKLLFTEPTPVEEHCPEVPDELAVLLTKMLAKEPEARPRDGVEVAHRLRALPPLPATRPRPTGGAEAHTVVIRGKQKPTHFCVLAGVPRGAPGNAAATISADAMMTMTAAITALDPGIHVEPMDGGGAAIHIAGGSADDGGRRRAEIAGQAARICRRAFPTLPIAIFAIPPSAMLQRGQRDAVDRAVDMLFKAMLRSKGAPALWIDDATRALIGDPLQ